MPCRQQTKLREKKLSLTTRIQQQYKEINIMYMNHKNLNVMLDDRYYMVFPEWHSTKDKKEI